MKKLVLSFMFFGSLSVFAQVGVGVSTANMDASAQLDISSTTKGLLAPRMTNSQKNAIANPATGLLIYQTDAAPGFYYFDGSVWKNGLGPQGIQGVQGEHGPMGMIGMNGIDGRDGRDGRDGNNASINIGAIDSFSNPNGVSINSGVLTLAPADAISGGIVTNFDQTFGGNKSFNNNLNVDGFSSFREASFNGFMFNVNTPGTMLRIDPMMGFDANAEKFNFQIQSFQSNGPLTSFKINSYNGIEANAERFNFNGMIADFNSNLNVFGNTTSNTFVKRGGTSTEYLMADGSVSTSAGGSVTVGPIDYSSNVDGASINSGVLTLAAANYNSPGVITGGPQVFAGTKTFYDGLRVENKPFLPTRLDQYQIRNLSFNSNELEEGMVVYNTTTRKLQVYSIASSSIINDSFAATFTNEDNSIFTQTFISPSTGIINAIQIYVKSDIENFIAADVNFQDSSDNNLGWAFGDLFLPNLGSPEWMNLQTNQIFVNSGQTYKFRVFSPSPIKFGINSNNYANGSLLSSMGGSANLDDLMFRIYITPVNGAPYWVNLN